jgi:hypothetical protein
MQPCVCSFIVPFMICSCVLVDTAARVNTHSTNDATLSRVPLTRDDLGQG